MSIGIARFRVAQAAGVFDENLESNVLEAWNIQTEERFMKRAAGNSRRLDNGVLDVSSPPDLANM